MEEQNWIKKEAEKLKDVVFNENRKPALKLIENKITELIIDFNNPFEEWKDEENNTIKKIIPVKVNNEEFVWWLNVKNPMYHKLIELGSKGQTSFKILQTGNKKDTKYVLVD